MEKEIVRQFTKFFEDHLSDRIGELYKELENLDEFKELSAKEDATINKLEEGLPPEYLHTFQAYSDVVDHLYILYRRFYYKVGFFDFPKSKKQYRNVMTLLDDYINERIKQYYGEIEKEEEFRQLFVENMKAYEKLKSIMPEELMQALHEFREVVQRKNAQYQEFYYSRGFWDCEEFLNSLLGDLRMLS